jgi:hypothetical protein
MNNESLVKLSPAQSVRLHHIGFVVASIQESGQLFALGLGATWDENIVLAPVQKVRVTFLQGRCSTDPLIELV